MKSKVCFADLTAQPERNLFAKLEELLEKAAIKYHVEPAGVALTGALQRL